LGSGPNKAVIAVIKVAPIKGEVSYLDTMGGRLVVGLLPLGPKSY